MTGTSTITEQDLRRMLDVVSVDTTGWDGPGLPDQVLQGLTELIPCSAATFTVMDPYRAEIVLMQEELLRDFPPEDAATNALFFEAFGECVACCQPEASRGPGVASTWLDFYTDRQYRSLLMAEYYRVMGIWPDLHICLPSRRGLSETIVLHRDRGDAPFSERDRLLLTLLRPHVTELRDRVEAQLRDVPALTPRQLELLRRVARGDTNRRLARDLGVSEGTVRKHLENIYARLDVHSRTEALARAGDLLVG